MIPNHQISSELILTDYLYEKPNTKLVDRSLGGVDLQDPSEGLEYQLWEIYYESPLVKIKGLSNNNIHILDSIPNITELSLSFDLNMNVSFTYVSNGESYLKYYDTLVQNYSIKHLENCKSPRLVYDDLREMQTNTSDIICAYINSSTHTLCYRLLRDRYTIEYPLHEIEPNAKLIRVGMGKGLRLQFKIQLL